MNRHLFELLKRIEEGARRLASTITFDNDKALREIALVDVEVTEIESALAAFKVEIANGASVGTERRRRRPGKGKSREERDGLRI